MGKPTIGYWNIRGLVEPIRLCLEYAEIEYEQKLYQAGGAPDYDRSPWDSVKFDQGLDFPNLPYYIDGDFKLTESWAILKHVGSKAGVLPKDEKSSATCHMLEGIISDFRDGFTSICYDPKFAELKETYIGNTTQKYEQFNQFLSGKLYLNGDEVTYVDFAFFETCDHQRLLFPNVFDKYPNIKAFMGRFQSLDKIAEYRKSSRFNKGPINNTMAKWTG